MEVIKETNFPTALYTQIQLPLGLRLEGNLGTRRSIMRRGIANLLGTIVVILLVAGPVALATHQQAQVRNFRVMQEDVLYRSGQMTLDGLKRIAHEYRIRTVISLRDKSHGGPHSADEAEENFCNQQEINYYRLPPQHWAAATLGDPAPVEDNVMEFRAVMADPKNYPVLIHCFAGIHRTGAYCAIYRMEHDHWTNPQAIEEIMASGYTDMESDVLGYLENYRPTWKGQIENKTTALKATKESRE
jgi:tyrosine-protein phosphatase SIW14